MKAEGERREGESSGGRPPDIEERTLAFGVRAVRLFRALQNNEDRAGWIVGRQFLRAATSVGANVAEARSGESRRDVVHKLQIAQKEAHESRYWLRLMERSALLSASQLHPLATEADEILRILAAMARNAKQSAPR